MRFRQGPKAAEITGSSTMSLTIHSTSAASKRKTISPAVRYAPWRCKPSSSGSNGGPAAISASASSCAPSRKRATIIKRFISASFVSRLAKADTADAPRHPGRLRSRLRVFRRLALEDHENAEVLVGGEAMVGARLDEDGAPLLHRDLLALDLQHTGALEHDVHLVVLVGLL